MTNTKAKTKAKAKGITVREITGIAMLFALVLLLSLVEGIMPSLPMLPPGVKLGLSNIVIMYAVFFLGKRQAFLLLLLKSSFVLLTKGITASFLSFGGGILSLFILFLFFSLKKQKFSYIITSVFAAIGHNIGQLICSAILLSSATVFYYTPVLLLSGIFMGVVTGVVLRVTLPALSMVSGK